MSFQLPGLLRLLGLLARLAARTCLRKLTDHAVLFQVWRHVLLLGRLLHRWSPPFLENVKHIYFRLGKTVSSKWSRRAKRRVLAQRQEDSLRMTEPGDI